MKGSCFGLYFLWGSGCHTRRTAVVASLSIARLRRRTLPPHLHLRRLAHKGLHLSHPIQMPDYADGHYHLPYTYQGWPERDAACLGVIAVVTPHMKDCSCRVLYNFCQTTETDTTTTTATLTKAGLKRSCLSLFRFGRSGHTAGLQLSRPNQLPDYRDGHNYYLSYTYQGWLEAILLESFSVWEKWSYSRTPVVAP